MHAQLRIAGCCHAYSIAGLASVKCTAVNGPRWCVAVGQRSISPSFCSSRFEWSGQGSDPFAKYTEMRFTDGTPCWQGVNLLTVIHLGV
jgi:hypothetical protein